MWQKYVPGLRGLMIRLEAAERRISALESFSSLDASEFQAVDGSRSSPLHEEVFDKKDPLVSVVVATYNRSGLLMDRCLRSIIGQTYKNIQVVVVGDCCTDDTELRIAALCDPRVIFINLAVNGPYPAKRNIRRWMVTGTNPMNVALNTCSGDFITHLDDDDEYELDRIATLVAFAQERRLEVVHHPFRAELKSGEWRVNPSNSFSLGQVTSSCTLYHRCFKHVMAKQHIHLLELPGDWSRFQRMKFMDATVGRHSGILTRHYAEGSQIKAALPHP